MVAVDSFAQLSRSVRNIAATVGVIVSLAVPVSVGVSSAYQLSGVMKYHTELAAERVAQYAYVQGTTWRFADGRVGEIIAFAYRGLDEQANLSILDVDNDEVVMLGKQVPFPSMRFQAPILVLDKQEGIAKFEVSLRPLFWRISFFMLPGLSLGLVAFFSVHFLPLRALRNATKDHATVQEKLRVQIEQTDEALRQSQVAAAKSEQANESKTLFLANMSHEIRTPMNGVLGLLGILGETDLTSTQQRYVQSALDSGESLLTILNEILDFSKIENGSVELENTPFYINAVIEGVTTLMRPRAENKGLTLSATIADGVPTVVVSDSSRIRQVLLNLVGNALKFTTSGGVSISVSHISQGDENAQIRFEVSDTGIGISEDAQEKIFQKFIQADATTTRRYGGTGLGLTISQQLSELLGGTIGVHSVPGKGSTFWFTARCAIGKPTDIADAVVNRDAPAIESSVDGMPWRVLVAEDNPVNQEIAAVVLRRAGHHVDIVGNGIEAVAAATRFPYDIILMDVQMPEMDGTDAARKIRALPSSAANVPIIALTASAMKSDQEECLAAGMDDYLSKPFNHQELLVRIDRNIQAKSKELEAAPAMVVAHDEADAILDDAIVKPLKEFGAGFLSELMCKFEENWSVDVAKLRQAFVADDSEAARRAAHRMKSSSANVGARRLSQCCNDIEMAGRAGELAPLRGLLSTLDGEYDSAIHALTAQQREAA